MALIRFDSAQLKSSKLIKDISSITIILMMDELQISTK